MWPNGLELVRKEVVASRRKHGDKWHGDDSLAVPSGTTESSLGGERLASERELWSCLPQGPAESPLKIQQRLDLYIFRKASSNASLQALSPC